MRSLRHPRSRPPSSSATGRFAWTFSLLAALTSALLSAQAGQRLPASTLLDEVRRSFTIEGAPIPPEIFRDLGDGDLSDSGSIIVAIDVRAAVGSNLYAHEIKRNGAWFSQGKAASKPEDTAEETSYRFVGTTPNKLLVAISSYNGGGSGTFYTLHILDAGVKEAFDSEGARYERVDVSAVRSIPLGDRWSGDVVIRANAIVIETQHGGPADESAPRRKIVEAERP